MAGVFGYQRASLFLRCVAEKRVFHAERAFFMNPSPEALVELGFPAAALGGRCKGHDSCGAQIFDPEPIRRAWD
jgi:hypothetical protein